MSSTMRDIIGISIITAIFMGMCVFIVPRAIDGTIDFNHHRHALYVKQVGEM